MKRFFVIGGFFLACASILAVSVTVHIQRASALDDSPAGQVLGKKTDAKETFLTFAKEEDGYTYGGLLSFTTEENPAFFLYGDALGKADVKLYRADKASLLEYLRYEKDSDGDVKERNRTVNTDQFTMVAEMEKTIKPEEREKIMFPLGDPGIYYVQARNGSEVKGEAFLSVSNMGALVREGNDEYIFWAQDTKTGKSLSSGIVSLYSVAEKVRETGSAQLNREGIATIAIGDGDDLAVVESGGDVSVIPINLTTVDWASYWLFRRKLPEGNSYTFTDRPLYQPGDTVYFKSVLRDDDDGRYSIPRGNVRVKVSQNEKNLYDGELKFTETGTVSGSFLIPKSGYIGWYFLTVEVVSEDGRIVWSGMGASFDIEEYRKPEYGIDLTLENDIVVAGETLSYRVSGAYFSGEPLSGKTVNYRVASSNMYTPSIASDVENDIDSSYRYGYFGSQTLEIGTATLDDNGEAVVMIQARIPEGSEGKNQIYSFEADFTDGAGEASFERKNALVYAGDFDVYATDRLSWSVQRGQPYVLPIQLVAHRDVSLSGVSLSTANVTRTYWTEYFIEGRKYPRYENHEEMLPNVSAVTDSNGRAELRFIPKDGGSYTLRVEGYDAKGNLVMNEFSFWVPEESGSHFDFSGDTTEQLFSLTTDRNEYDPTEQAQVTISSAIPGRDVFFSVERGRTERYQIVHISGKSQTFPLPLNGDDMPNVFLSVAGFSSEAFSTRQLGISVSPEEKRLEVSIVQEKQSYQPGEDITLSIETKNKKTGRPVSAEVAVYAVDKAIFELIDAQPGDIFKTFWRERYNDTQGAHSLQGISFYGAEKGGGGGDVRSVFKDTAYWNPMVKTAENGKATVSFPLPDNLTTWVVSGIANTAQTEVGQTREEVVVSKSVSIRPTLPNMLREGDTATLSAVVQNATTKEQKFLASIDFEGGELLSDRAQSVVIKPGQTREVFFGVRADHQSSEVKVGFSVVAESDATIRDAVELFFPIEESGVFQDREERMSGDATEFSYDFSPDADLSRSSLSIGVSPSIFASAGMLSKTLIEYPFGCVEQATSRLVPAILAKQGGSIFTKALEGKDVDAIIKKGVKRLGELQNEDGGFAWWHGDSDPFVTAYVSEYLLEAKFLEKDMEQSARINEILDQTRAYFDESGAPLAWPDYRDDTIPVNLKREARDLDVIRLYGRSLFGLKNTHQITDFTDMDADILSLAVIANIWNGDRNPKTNGADVLLKMGIFDAGSRIHWSAGPMTRFGSQDVSTAMAIRVMSAIPELRAVAVSGLHFLESNMSPAAWDHTFASAQTLRAITDFLRSGGRELTNPDYTYEVFVDGKSMGSGHISTMEQSGSLEIPGVQLGRSGTVSVRQTGTGTMMLSKKVHEFRTGTAMQAIDHGISIHREYINTRRPGEMLLPGDTVTVRLRVDGDDSNRYIVIRDELPGGMVPVQEQFKNAEFDAVADGGYSWYRSVEVTGNGVTLSLENFWGLRDAKNVFEYQARVVSSGEFFAPPSFAALMYTPDVYGYSEGGMVKIDGPKGGNLEVSLTPLRWAGIVVVSILTLLGIGFTGIRFYRKKKNIAEQNDFPTDI